MLFALSGASALVYQVVWLRRLALIFGVTAHALGVVLAAFMSGLAVGAVAGGWIAQRTNRPLAVFALVEIATGILAAAVLPALQLAEALYVPVAASNAAVGAVLRLVLALAVLLPPTICMGMTLPLLARASIRWTGLTVGRLYAANTAGAVGGALACGFLLIGLVGLSASVWMAALVNVSIGTVVLWALAPAERAEEAHAARMGVPRRDVARTLGLASFAVSGFTTLAYEVIWARLLSVLTSGVVYGFTLMLATVLTGIAVGSALYDRRRDRDHALRQIAWLQLGIGLVVASSLLVVGPLLDGPVPRALAAELSRGGISERWASGLTGVPVMLGVIFLASVLSGAAFPAAARAAGASAAAPRDLGIGYAVNVAASVLGSLGAAFVLVPLLGAHASLLTMASINVALAVWAMVAGEAARTAATMALIALVAIGLAGAGRSRLDIYEALVRGRLGPGSEIIWHAEGAESSVAVARGADGARLLLINGEIHGGTRDIAYHRLFGHLGMLLHRAPRDVLLIGFGAGATADAVARYPDVRIELVELSEGVLQAADALADVNHGVLRRPAVVTRVGDGRNHLLVSDRRYDVIVSGLVLPKHAGASVVYSREFFELARRRLTPDGIMVQWLGSPREPREFTWTAPTFASVFPAATFWMNGEVGAGAIMPRSPIDPARLASLQRDPGLKRELDGLGLRTIADVEALSARTPDVIGRTTVITDDRPSLEYFLTLPLLARLRQR